MNDIEMHRKLCERLILPCIREGKCKKHMHQRSQLFKKIYFQLKYNNVNDQDSDIFFHHKISLM